MKLKFTFIILSLFLSLTTLKSAVAQNVLEEKIKNIEGSVDKIIITSGGKEYTFEGADAEKLFKQMKNSKSHSFVWNASGDESNKKKVIIFDAAGENEVIEIESEDDDVFILKTDKDLDSISDAIQKKVIVEVEDGNKKVTVTTKENGEEKTEVYKGKEAEEYIEKMKAENKNFDISIDNDKDSKKVKKIIIETEKDSE